MNLKDLRLKKGLKRKEVAEKEGVSLSTVAMWEQGKRIPWKRAESLSALYGVSLKEIFLVFKNTNSDKKEKSKSA